MRTVCFFPTAQDLVSLKQGTQGLNLPPLPTHTTHTLTSCCISHVDSGGHIPKFTVMGKTAFCWGRQGVDAMGAVVPNSLSPSSYPLPRVLIVFRVLIPRRETVCILQVPSSSILSCVHPRMQMFGAKFH